MKSLSILLVDDDEIIRLKFKKVCKDLNVNHSIVEAENGEKALAVLKDHHFDLIVSDLKMPVMNGIEFIKEVKKVDEFKNIPIVVMTTSTEHEDMESCNGLNIEGYFIKSLNFSEYKIEVSSIVNYWSSRENVVIS